jgi:hypothetical protein
VVGLLIGTELNGKSFMRYLETGDKSTLDAAGQGVVGSGYKPFLELFEKADAAMMRVRNEGADPKQAAKEICALFKGVNYVPTYFKWHDTSVRTTPAFTIGGMTRMYFWYLFKSPRCVFQDLYGWKPLTAYGYIFSAIMKNVRLARRRRRGYIRDVFMPWNKEWTDVEQSPRSEALKPAAAVTEMQVSSAVK